MDKHDHDEQGHRVHEHDETEREHKSADHRGAATGALIGTVSVGPLGAPIGAAAGAVVDALMPDPADPSSHTHDRDTACYDGCPAWRSEK